MLIVSIVEIIMFLVEIKTGNAIEDSMLIYDPHRRGDVWRFVTFMFVHENTRHIMTNLIVQIFLGVALELVHSWWRVSLVYVAGVAAGSLGSSLVLPHKYLCGASSGVYALITAHIATIIMVSVFGAVLLFSCYHQLTRKRFRLSTVRRTGRK